MHHVARWFAGLALCVVAGCSPAFDWREVRFTDGLLMLFPCRPQTNVRRLVVAGEPRTMELRSCSAGEQTFAVGRVDVTESARVEAVKQDLREALRINLAASPRPAVTGAGGTAPDPVTSVDGSGPDGKPMQAQSRVFNVGIAVFQATVIGRRLAPEQVDFFFSSIKAPA